MIYSRKSAEFVIAEIITCNHQIFFLIFLLFLLILVFIIRRIFTHRLRRSKLNSNQSNKENYNYVSDKNPFDHS